MKEDHEVEAFNQSNDGYTTAGVIQLRLDTAPTIDNLEAFLRGKRITGYQNRQGGVVPVYSNFGVPKMNEEGIQSVMAWVTILLNPSTVQGNFPTKEDCDNYLADLRDDFNSAFWNNRVDWEMKKREVEYIIDMIMSALEPYFTRLIASKERDSYGQSMVHRESSHSETGKKFGLL